MTFRELAAFFDAHARPVEAAWAYEIAIQNEDSDPDPFLDLAVLYFECVDFGFAAEHKLSEPFVTGAWQRMLEVLDEPEERFGKHTEVQFWRLYFGLIYFGEKVPESEFKLLAERGDSLVPYFHLFVSSGRKKYVAKARQLLALVANESTQRKRYISSLLSD